MAREVGLHLYVNDITEAPYAARLKAFEALVRADERAANIACIGRIAAMVVDPIDQARLYQAMDSIRARGSA
jgi:AmiR/NasT family two-component response regulator